MDIHKIFIIFIVGIVFSGVAAGLETTITPTSSNIGMKDLKVVIHVHVKNNQDHVEYFKVSQQYFQLSPTLNWTLDWTSPPAVRMATNVNPTGDFGWEIQPGETKTVCFQLSANGALGSTPGFIIPNDTVNNQFWPLIPDPGLAASWFMPNELEMLNPNLKIELWQGTFDFNLIDLNNNLPRVQGIVRAPIVPLDSMLTFSDPQVTFIDKDFPGADTAAWDVTLFPGEVKHFTYTYQFPKSGSTEPSHAAASSTSVLTNASEPVSVPTKTTGVPYGLLVVALVMMGAGLGYTKFLR